MVDRLIPSVCIDAVLGHMTCDDALRIVANAGISAFEFWGWWEKDLARLMAARDRHGLNIAACCTKFISLVDPNRRDDYLRGLSESIAVAQKLDCPTLISQVGDFQAGVPRSEQHDSLVEGLKAAAPMLEQADITLVIEPLNELVDHAGYYLVRSDEAFAIIDEVGSPCVKVLFDIYHQQVSEGHLIHTITSNIERIGHFHAAGNPGRHELTVGELDYPSIFAEIQATNYTGYVGLEYWPSQAPEAGLNEVAGWFV
ncbi:MAG: hydroxypyruvate isomerase family protein [Planctomycetota bacterium]